MPLGCSTSYKFTKNYSYVLVFISTQHWNSTPFSFNNMSITSKFYVGEKYHGQQCFWFKNVQSGASIDFSHNAQISAGISVLGIE